MPAQAVINPVVKVGWRRRWPAPRCGGRQRPFYRNASATGTRAQRRAEHDSVGGNARAVAGIAESLPCRKKMNIEHSTFNIQRPTRSHGHRHWLFGVECWLLDVSSFFNSMAQRIPKSLTSRLKPHKNPPVRCGRVLTDGSVYVGGAREMKRFNIRDGLGLVFSAPGRFQGRLGFRAAVAGDGARAAELQIDFLVQAGRPDGQDRRGRKNFCAARNWIGTRSVSLAMTWWIWDR